MAKTYTRRAELILVLFEPAASVTFSNLITKVRSMGSHLPPIPPANRSKKDRGDCPESTRPLPVQHAETQNTSEQGETANIKQNTTNKGFFRGRRMK